jgi:stage III sporulation protein AG
MWDQIKKWWKMLLSLDAPPTQPSHKGGKPQTSSGGQSPFRNTGWLLVLLLIGGALMVMTSFFKLEKEVMPVPEPVQGDGEQAAFVGSKSNEPMTIVDYEEMYESELRDMLQEIVGVGSVSVMVTLHSSEEIQVMQDIQKTQSTTREKDRNGGEREKTDTSMNSKVVIHGSSDGEKPIVVKTIKPTVRGVLIVAKGAEDVRVQKMIIEAVQKSLSVPMHRISVLPKKH